MKWLDEWKERRALRKKYRPLGGFLSSYDASLYECTNAELEAVRRYLFEKHPEDTPQRRYVLAMLATIPERGEVFRQELERLTREDSMLSQDSGDSPSVG